MTIKNYDRVKEIKKYYNLLTNFIKNVRIL